MAANRAAGLLPLIQSVDRIEKRILGVMSRRNSGQRDLNKVQSEADRRVEKIDGVADAKAVEIYAIAYNQSADTMAFQELTRTMQAYESPIGGRTTLLFSADSEIFKFLKGTRSQTSSGQDH